MRREGKAASEGYGTVWYSAFCKYPSLRFCSHRGIFLYDDFQNPVRLSSLCWHHDPFLSSSGVFAIGAPGVPGGTVMASLGIITGVLGFNETGTALMLTIFALQDSFGTACNVTGDGALTLFLTGYAKRHHIQEQNIHVDL